MPKRQLIALTFVASFIGVFDRLEAYPTTGWKPPKKAAIQSPQSKRIGFDLSPTSDNVSYVRSGGLKSSENTELLGLASARGRGVTLP